MNGRRHRSEARIIARIAVLTSVAVLASGCWAAPPPQSSNATGERPPAGGPQRGGTLRIALDLDPGCLDPAVPSFVPSITRNIADSLTDQDPDTGKIVPWLATSWTVNKNATAFTFTLRTDMTFSDGTRFDADVVKRNFDVASELGAQLPAAATALAGYSGTTVHNDKKLTVRFNQPNIGFLQASSSRALAILGPATLEKSPQQRCQGELIGTGPFVLKSYVPDRGATLVRRKGHTWGSAARANRGAAYLDSIEYQVIAEAGVRSGSLTSGQVDIIDVAPQDEARFETGDTYLASHVQAGVVSAFHINHDHPILREKAVRRAMLIGINRKQIVDTVFTPRHPVATSVLSHTQPEYLDLSAKLRFDPDSANALLDKAGWVRAPDGIRERAGQRLELDIILRGMAPVAELAQQQLRRIGIDLSIRQLTSAEYREAEDNGRFALSFSQQSRPDPDILRAMYSSRDINPYGVAPSKLDDILEAQAAESDPQARTALVHKAQRLLIEQAYTIPLYEGVQVHAASTRVNGLIYDMSSTHIFTETWLSS